MSSAFCSESYRCKNKDWCAKDYRPELDGYECLEPMTNADRIRSMTDEELAKKMSGLESFALTCGGGWPPEKWLDWLKQEVE